MNGLLESDFPELRTHIRHFRVAEGIETAYILSGRGRLIVEGEETLMEAGWGVTIPKGMSHRMYNIGESPLIIFAFHIPPAR